MSSKGNSREKQITSKKLVQGEWNERREVFQETVLNKKDDGMHPPEESFDQWKAKEDAFHLE